MSKGFCVVPENPLYKQIHKIVADHEKANLIYALTQSKEFQNTFGSSLIYDSKGYPTLESVMSLFNDDMIQQSDVFRKSLETDLNTNMPTRNVDVVRRAVEFNKKATPCYAKIVDINGQQSQIQLVKRNNDTSEIETLENNLRMFDTIDNLLKKLGINIKILDPSYFRGEDALMIPSNLNKQANGILGVINLANNYAGFKALPEEFGHFLIECCKSNPIIGRCEAYLADNLELCQSILGTEFQSIQNYYNQKNRPDLFFREVLGRIVAQYLNSGEVDSNTLLSRGENAVKRFIEKTFKITNQDQKDTFNLLLGFFNTVNEFVDIVNNDTQQTSNILQFFSDRGDVLAHTQEDFTTNVDAIMDKLSRNASKYVAVYRKQNKELTDVINSVFWGGLKQLDPETQQQQLNALYSAYIKNPNSAHTNVLMQLIRYKTIISSSNILFSEQVTKLKTLKQDLEQKGYTIESILQNAHKIQQLKNLILVYNDSIQEFLDELTNVEFLEDYNDEEKALLEGVKDDIYKLFTYIRKANSEVEDFSYKLIYNYYLSTFNPNGEDKIQLAGTSLNAETTISLTDVLHYTHGDISTMKRLLDTGYNSSDILTQLVSTKIKQQQEKIRLMTTTDAQNLSTLLEKYGKDTQFMHEMTKDGKPTGYYINKYGVDFAKFDEEKKNAFAAIDKRKHLSDDEKSILKAKWYQDNTRPITLTTYTLVNNVWSVNPNVTMTVKIPIKDSRWSSDAYDNLSTEQKELCDTLLEYKHKLDYINGLTGNFRPFKCVQRTVSSLTESVVNKDGSVLEILKNKLRFTDEDVEQYGNQINNQLMFNNGSFFARIKAKINRIFNADTPKVTDSVTQLSDFEGKLYRRVPLNYVNDLQNISQLSTNAFDSLLHYAAATYQHECMNEIVDIMELTKAQANKRRQKQYDSTGRKIRSKLGPGDDQYEDLTLPSAGSNINKQLENIINTQVYGEFKQKGTTILNDTISLSKLTDGILRLTSLSMLGYNPFTAINNVVVGKSQMLIQSIGSEHFTFNDWLQADKEYFSLLQEYLGELGKPFKTSKLALIEQMFNPHNEWWEQTVQKGIYKPNSLRVFETVCGPSFMMQAGEHHMKMSTCLALMFGMKMIDTKNGNKETNLYDALESYTVPNSSGNGTHLELRIRDGVVKPDGKPFTLQSFNQIERSDLQQFTDLTTIINHRMHGVYDKEDYIEAKQYAIGRIFLLFRNFMFPFFSRRWKGISTLKTNQQRYNIQLNTTDEGYYVTTMKFLKQMFFPNTQNLRDSGGFIARAQMLIDGLSTTEKQNFYKMFSETITTLITWLLLFGLFRDWDDHEGNWVARATNYFTRRLQAEMTYAWNPSTLLDILQSPTPVMGPLKDITRVLKSIGDDHILKTGPYKGQTRFAANLKRALPIIPNVIDFFNLDTEDKKFKVFEDTFWYKNSKENSE